MSQACPPGTSQGGCTNCTLLIATKRNVGALWAEDLRKTGKCPIRITGREKTKQMTTNANKSTKMINAQKAKINGGNKWKTVRWSEYMAMLSKRC